MDTASNQYLRNAVMTASKEQLHLMLYDGAIRFTHQGIKGLECKNYEESYNGFSRAQKIVLEMLNSLNYDVDKELCTRMAGLYNFIYQNLLDASVQRNPALARESLKILEYQRETWVMLIDKLQKERSSEVEFPEEAATEELDNLSYGTLSVQG